MKNILIVLFLLLPSISYPSPYTLTLDEVPYSVLARVVYGDILHRSYVLESELLKSPDLISVNWIKLSRSQVLDSMDALSLSRGLVNVDRGGVLFVDRLSVKDSEDVLIYSPRFRSSQYLSDIVSGVTDAKPVNRRGVANTLPNSGSATAASAPTSALSRLDRAESDQLALVVSRLDRAKVENLLVQLDTPQPEVMLRAAVYEVGTMRGEGSAIQLASSLLRGQLSGSAGALIGGANSLTITTSKLDAVFSILDQDSRFKVVSRPMLRVRSGTQAKFSVGQQVPVLGAVSYDNQGNSIQSVEYRQSGTIFTVKPDIHLDVIDLNISQELSSFVNTTTGVNNSPTMLQRTATSQLSIRPGEVVVFAGLEEQRDDAAESGLFGFTLSDKMNNSSSEVLLFIEAERI